MQIIDPLMRDQAGNWLRWVLSVSGCVGLRKSLSSEPLSQWTLGEVKSPRRESAHGWESSCIPVHGKTGLWGAVWFLVFTSIPPFLCCAVSGVLSIHCFSVMSHQCAAPVSQCPFYSGWWQHGVNSPEVAIRIPGWSSLFCYWLAIW